MADDQSKNGAQPTEHVSRSRAVGRARWTALVVSLLVVVGLAGCGGATEGNATTTTSSTGASGAAALSLPVVECPTTYGVAGTPTAIVADTLATSLPKSEASQLSYYSDAGRSIAPVLGPKNWPCHAVVAADGGINIVVTKPGTLPSSTASPGFQGVLAQSSGACQGCTFQLACAVIA